MTSKEIRNSGYCLSSFVCFKSSRILIAFSLSFIATPVLEFAFDMPLVTLGDTAYHIPGWLTLLIAFAGVLLMPATMHLAKFAGRAHGALAKAMLVSD